MTDRYRSELYDYLTTLKAIENFILHERILADNKLSQDEIRRIFNCSRETVRLTEGKMIKQISLLTRRDIENLVNYWNSLGRHVIGKQEVMQSVKRHEWSAPNLIHLVIYHQLVEALGFKLQDSIFVSQELQAIAIECRREAKAHDDDAGIVAEEKLLGVLPNREFRKHWWRIMDLAGIHRIHGSYTTRKSRAVNVKAALIKVGRPATRQEIASLANESIKNASVIFSRLKSVSRVSKSLWALQNWGYPVYEGIVKEIEKRIKSAGGSANIKELLNDLNDFYEVKEESVFIFMHTNNFIVKDGQVSTRPLDDLNLKPLASVISGRDDQNRPQWKFKVLERYFRGYSVSNVPPEVALAIGCIPNKPALVKVSNVPLSRDLSLQWQRSSTSQAWLGRVAEVLEKMNAQEEDEVVMTILDHCKVKLEIAPPSNPSDD